MAYIYDLTDTWNAGGTTFYGIKMNVTNTASASGSKLLSLQVGGSEKFGVDKNGAGYFSGNVGIGTSSPAWNLEIASSITSKIRLYNTTGNGNVIDFVDQGWQSQINGSAGVLAFNTGGTTERMRIDATGNVGIGTSSPGTRLDVWTPNGTATTVRWAQTGVTNYDWRIPASTDAFTLNYGGTTERMRIDSSGRLMVGITGALNNNMISAYGTNQNGFVAQVTNNIYSNFQGFNASTVLTFGVDGPGNGYFAGNVGIGTSSPGYKLTVNGGDILVSRGSGAAAADAAINFGGNANNYIYSGNSSNIMAFATNGSERARIDSSGNLLVGTTSANGKLSVVGNQISIGSGDGPNTLGIQIKGTALSAIPAAQVQGYIATGDSSMGVAGDLLIAPRTDAAANIRFITGTSPAERMRITGAGNLQLGTASLATTATDGFPYIPTCAGTPTGTPTAITGYAPMVVDSTNNKLYVYVGGAWQAMN